MAVIKAVSSKAGIGQALDYVTKEEKTEDKLVSGLHCEPDTVKDEMQATKELWGKTGGRTYKHFVQSYHEDEHITPEQAHRNAVELAKNTEAWKGHEVLIATHIDRGHIHSHFIVNSVNYNDSAQKTPAVRKNVRWMNAPITNNATIIQTGFSSGIVGFSWPDVLQNAVIRCIALLFQEKHFR